VTSNSRTIQQRVVSALSGQKPKTKSHSMAAKKTTKKAATGDLIISKSRTKAAVKKCNVSSDFYPALDKAVRSLIQTAETRATGNKRKTLRPQDL